MTANGVGWQFVLSTPNTKRSSPPLEAPYATLSCRSMRLTMASNRNGALAMFSVPPPLATSHGLVTLVRICVRAGTAGPLIGCGTVHCLSQVSTKFDGVTPVNGGLAISVIKCPKDHGPSAFDPAMHGLPARDGSRTTP